ncbi:DUF4377 domain-containing protein [Nocardia goodfellowii]|uniref:DUF4377 domain-containing protein n=1 Tax=Nocardia goodfellowii TaxID=882446 RepID=A0ABS4QV19_9NOCA|nr:DUF4377 domain-containing protein [Nocardia goodfellowii]MBP2194456.1 hypothetical protein [Nocardia goodfellowii]
MRLRLSHVALFGLAILPVATACTSPSLAESPAVSAAAPGTSAREGAFGNFGTVHPPGSSADAETVLELDVAQETMRCTETSDEQCLQIRRDPNGPWELCYDGIDGFDHDRGYRYHLRVEQSPAENPRAEAPAWRLLEVLDKQRVISATGSPLNNTGLEGPAR